jgi:hypothetical protein
MIAALALIAGMALMVAIVEAWSAGKRADRLEAARWRDTEARLASEDREGARQRRKAKR